MAKSDGSISEKTRYEEFRKAVRKKEAGPLHCLYFVKTLDANQKASDVLDVVKCLRNELPLKEAVTFLDMYLELLDPKFCDENPFFVFDVELMLAEDLWDSFQRSKATEKCKKIVQWATEHPDCLPGEALASAKLARFARELGSDSDAEEYARKAHDILFQRLYRDVRFLYKCKSEAVSIGKTYVVEAFLELGEVFRLQKKASEAKKCFQKALHLAEKNGIQSEYVVYSYLHQLQALSNEMPPDTPDLNVTLDNIFAKILAPNSNCAVCFDSRAVLRIEVNRAVKSALEMKCACKQQMPSLPRQFHHNSIVNGTLRSVETAVCSTYMALAMGWSNCMEHLEMAKKLLDACSMDCVDKCYDFCKRVVSLLCLFSKLCVQAKFYKEAETYAKRALRLSTFVCNGERALLGDAHYTLGLVYYHWRGHIPQATVQLLLASMFKENDADECRTDVLIIRQLIQELQL